MTAEDRTTSPRHHRHGRLWLGMGGLLIALLAVFAVLGMTGRPIALPGFIVAHIESRANKALAGQVVAHIGGAVIVIDAHFVPHVALRDVTLYSARGNPIAVLPQLRAQLSGAALLQGRAEAQSLEILGARVALRRLPDGGLDVSLGGEGSSAVKAQTPAQVLDTIDAAFAAPGLATIRTISVTGLELRLDDQRTDQVWRVTDGTLNLAQNDRQIGIGVFFRVAEAGYDPAQVELSFLSLKASSEAQFYARVTDLNSRDLAAQAPALAWLSALDTRLSGRITAGIRPDGTLAPLAATLDLGPGALRPTAEARPVGFSKARLDLVYDAETAKIDFRELSVDSPALRVTADGQAWLRDMRGGFPTALVGQVRIGDLKADPAGLFDKPVRFSQGALDLKLNLDPFRLSIGQLVLIDAGRRISLKGEVGVEKAGWSVATDVAIDAITSDRLLALWPVSAVPNTRQWLADNVATGELFDVTAAMRLAPGAEPRLSLGYEFRDAEVTFMKTLPPIQDGAGYSTIDDNAYTLVVEHGHLRAPSGGDVNVAGTVLRVPDMRIKPAPAAITLHSDSTITAALALLDQPPFQFLTKAGKPVDLAEGRATLTTDLALAFVKKLRPEDVDYHVAGTLHDVRSDRIVPGRVLQAPALQVTADRAGLTIAGPGTLSGVPFDATWVQKFGPQFRGHSRVDGWVELSPGFIDAFQIGLPKGMVTGKGRGTVAIDLAEGKDTAMHLSSDLRGLRLSLPEVGWSKGDATPGKLEVAGTLGKPAHVSALTLEAPGLAAQGSVQLHADGSFDRAQFDTVSLRGWFDGALAFRGRGRGKTVAIDVLSGRADLGRSTFGTGGASTAGVPLSVALDTLQVTQGIALTGFRGDFNTAGGLNGDFRGSVNGRAPVTGVVSPMDGRSAFRILSEDAGAVMRAAGVFTKGQGGSFNMLLKPDGPDAGHYAGRLTMKKLRVVNAPVLAELLGAISVVGLLEQLNEAGILFNDVVGDYRIIPGAVEISKGSAVGASLGVSGAGIYATDSEKLNIQGTISPIYLLNGIGQIFTRKGEGLFGFNYRLTGTADKMQVAVNPLSILTPGMFREIFRSAPPKVAP